MILTSFSSRTEALSFPLLSPLYNHHPHTLFFHCNHNPNFQPPNMPTLPTFFTLLLLLLLLISTISSTDGTDARVKAACSVTNHQSLCIRSLTPFSNPIARNPSPSRWARAAVSVTLAETERVGRYLTSLKNGGSGMRGRARFALQDCVECFDDAVGELHNSLREIRMLARRTFAAQMSDVETWVSAALTNQGTCLDGFRGVEGDHQVRVIRSKVVNATYFTSNALALINKLASSGGRDE